MFLLLSKVKIKTMRDKCLSFFRKISSKEIKTKWNMVDIYKNHQNYKIVTVYQAASGLGIISEPVFFLALDTTAEELSKVIFEGLRQSRSISESEEEEIRNNGHKKLLKALKEPSFKSLYKNSTSCNIVVENKEVRITPWKYLGGNKGMAPDSAREITMEFSETKYIEMAQLVMDMLN